MKNQTFTVKHVQPSGHIEYMATDQVSYHPDVGSVRRQVFVRNDDGGVTPLDSGSVYIMNIAGKTIDQYHFPYGELRGHASDCAANNSPAYEAGPCDCGHAAA